MRRLAPLILLLAGAVFAAPAGGQSESSLRNSIDKGKAAERALGSAAERLGRLEAQASKEVAILEGRLSEAQSELDRAVAAADAAEQALGRARARVARLKIRLGEVEDQLAALLRERYMGSKPDLVTVVLESSGFAQLLETLDFIKTIQRRDAMIVGL